MATRAIAPETLILPVSAGGWSGATTYSSLIRDRGPAEPSNYRKSLTVLAPPAASKKDLT